MRRVHNHPYLKVKGIEEILRISLKISLNLYVLWICALVLGNKWYIAVKRFVTARSNNAYFLPFPCILFSLRLNLFRSFVSVFKTLEMEDFQERLLVLPTERKHLHRFFCLGWGALGKWGRWWYLVFRELLGWKRYIIMGVWGLFIETSHCIYIISVNNSA